MSACRLPALLLVSFLGSALAGCGSTAEFDGTLIGRDFSTVTGAFHGGSILLFVDGATDCLDVGWAGDRYYDGVAPSQGADFVALQITFDGSLSTGTFTVGNDAPFSADALVLEGGVFELEHARDGSIVIEEISGNGEAVTGNLSIAFGEDAVGGNFVTEYCSHLAL